MKTNHESMKSKNKSMVHKSEFLVLRLRGAQRGQTTVLIALALVCLFGAAAIVVERRPCLLRLSRAPDADPSGGISRRRGDVQ